MPYSLDVIRMIVRYKYGTYTFHQNIEIFQCFLDGTDADTGLMLTSTGWTAKVTSTAQGAIARNTVQCDISALTDSEYIKVVGSYSAGEIYNIWLE